MRYSFDTEATLCDGANGGAAFANPDRVAWSPNGVKGGAAYFSGGHGGLVLPVIPDSLRGDRPFTLSFWFRFPRLKPSEFLRRNFDFGLVGWGTRNGADPKPPWCCFALKARHDRAPTPENVKDQWFIHAYGGAGFSGGGTVAYDLMHDGCWHLYTVTRDRTDGGSVRRIYIDGRLRSENAGRFVRTLDETGCLLFGATFHGRFKGWLDELEILPRAMTPAEVAAAWAGRDRARTERAAPAAPEGVLERVYRVEKPYLLFPVAHDGNVPALQVLISDAATGAPLRTLGLAVAADARRDWTGTVDCRAWMGREIAVTVTGNPAGVKDPFAVFAFSDRRGDPPNLYHEPNRLQFHFSPPVGYMNDPNGLVYLDGEWRLMYQHAPHCSAGPWKGCGQFWGYATSTDLLHWTDRGDAVMPYPLCRNLISGSGVIDRRNTAGFGANAHVCLVATGGAPGGSGLCLWYSTDGRTYVPYEKNPVSVETGCGADPKVNWHEPTKRWIMVSHGVEDNCFRIKFHSSADLKVWKFESSYFGDHRSKGRQHFLHECPGLEELRIEGESGTGWVVWGAGPEYAVGSFDGHVFRPSQERLWSLQKRETAYYAAQTFQNAPEGRCVYIPWYTMSGRGPHFNQALGVPVDLTLRRTNGGLRMARRPVKELQALREGDAVDVSAFRGELAELRVTGHLADDAVVELNLRGETVRYVAATERLYAGGEDVYWPLGRDGALDLILYLDRQGLECFSGDGLSCWPFRRVYPQKENLRLAARTTGNVTGFTVRAWRLRSVFAK